LFIADNIPKRFKFLSLTIKRSSTGNYKAVYVYTGANGELLSINQESIQEEPYSFNIINITKEIETEDGTIYISENPFGDGTNAASYITESFIIDVTGLIGIEEILDILKE